MFKSFKNVSVAVVFLSAFALAQNVLAPNTKPSWVRRAWVWTAPKA